MSSRLLIDTNVLLRFFLNEHPPQSSTIQRWLQQTFGRRDPELILVPTVLTEMVAVLRTSRPVPTHQQILGVLDALLDMPFTIVDRLVVSAAVEQYRQARARDWEDCLIAAYATHLAGGRLATYDRSLSQFPGIVAIVP